MKYFLLTSLVCCCGFGGVFHALAVCPVNDDGKTVFNDSSTSYLYKSKIDLYGHYLSGLILIKPLGHNNYKVAFTTEFGSKILDFEFNNGNFILNDCIEEMRRKQVLKLLELDMRLLLGVHGKPQTQENTGGFTVTAYKTKKGRANYLTDEQSGNIVKIFTKRGKKIKVSIELLDYIIQKPGNIIIRHNKKPVSIELNLLKQ